MTLEGVASALALAAVVYVVYGAGSRAAASTEWAFTGYFRGHRPDPWPRGVQEEDRDRPWGTGVVTEAAAETDGPTVVAVVEVERSAPTMLELAPMQRVSARVVARRTESLFR